MKLFAIKRFLASIFDFMGINQLLIRSLNKKHHNNYIRVINMHHVLPEDKEKFAKQIEWYSKAFELCTIDDLELFLNGEKTFEKKPGMIITFDDGYLDNYTIANKVLSERKITALFMVSAGFVGKKVIKEGIMDEYMSANQLIEISQQGSTIGCHTYTHHRMAITDSNSVLRHEIIDSKLELERLIGKKCTIFCWCGGEEDTYTKAASDVVKLAGYKYSFMTNNAPIESSCDRLMLDRTNIEANWSLSLVRFQLNGIIDKIYKKKREKIHLLVR